MMKFQREKNQNALPNKVLESNNSIDNKATASEMKTLRDPNISVISRPTPSRGVFNGERSSFLGNLAQPKVSGLIGSVTPINTKN